VPSSLKVLFDTGPLLCFATCNHGLTLLKKRYASQSSIAMDIYVELEGLGRSASPVLSSAAVTAYRGTRWLRRIVVTDVHIRRAEQLKIDLQAFKNYPKLSAPMSRQDWGECVTLALAEDYGSSVLVIANDTPPRQLASLLRIPTAAAVDVLRGMIRDGAITKKAAFHMYQQMVAVGTEAGEVINGPTDF
jgi:uncharacterized protein with PIN domain